MTTTFEQWQARRRYVADLSAFHDYEEGPGLLYPALCYINDAKRPDLGGRFRLIIERDETYSDDLPALERKLFDWAKHDGWELNDPEFPDPFEPLVKEYLAWLRVTPSHRLENPGPVQIDWVRGFLKRCADARKIGAVP